MGQSYDCVNAPLPATGGVHVFRPCAIPSVFEGSFLSKSPPLMVAEEHRLSVTNLIGRFEQVEPLKTCVSRRARLFLVNM